MSVKLGFAAGLMVGVLAGSRAGRGLYDRSAAAATAVVHDPRVRSGASAALHRAGSAGSTVAGAAARKVRNRGKAAGEEDEQVDGAEKDGGKGELKARKRRLIGGVRKHGFTVNGHGVGVRNSSLHRSHKFGHSNRENHAQHPSHQPGMSAPSVQAKPKGEDGRSDSAQAGDV